MGSNAYSVIELSMVEKILNGKPEERRQIFEEAAGVTKYKIRRRAAFRKLEATEQDLIRLSDIISEVEKTTNSLRRQVNKATRYRDMSRELRQLELDYSACNYAKIQQELNPLEEKSTETIDRKEKISAELATKEAEVEKKQVNIIELERQLNARGADLSANRQRIHEREEEILVCQERIKALKTAQERATNEIDELMQRASDIVDENGEVTENLHTLREKLTETESELHDARATLAEIQANYADWRAAGKDLESTRLNLIEEIASIQKNEERLRTHLAFSDGRIKTIENESTKLDFQFKEIAGKKKELSEQRQIYRDQADDLDEELATTTRDLELARENVERCRAALLQMQGEIKTRQDRIGLLRKVLESYEEYPVGVRYLMRQKDQVPGYHGTLGNPSSVEVK